MLYINCSGPIRWPFLIAIMVMYLLATADALFALYVLMQYYLRGEEFPVLVPLPTVLLFLTSRCVRDVFFPWTTLKVFHLFSVISDFFIVCFLVDNLLWRWSNAQQLFRCYASWYHLRRIIIIPCMVLLCVSSRFRQIFFIIFTDRILVSGYTFAISASPHISKLFPIYSWMNFGFNACLTIVICELANIIK